MADTTYDWGSILGSGLGAVGSLYAGSQGNKAINNALNSQTQSAGQAQGVLAPYQQVGLNAIGGLNKMMSGNYDLSSLPGYTAGLQSGEKAINRGLAARGNFGAGGSIPALTKFNQDYAQQQYGNEFNRLASLLNVGQNAANAQSGIYQGLGNAQGAAGIASSNNTQNSQLGAIQSLANLLGTKTSNGTTTGTNLVSGIGSALGNGYDALSNWWNGYDNSYNSASTPDSFYQGTNTDASGFTYDYGTSPYNNYNQTQDYTDLNW